MYEYLCWYDVTFSLYVNIFICMSICAGKVTCSLYVDTLIYINRFDLYE